MIIVYIIIYITVNAYASKHKGRLWAVNIAMNKSYDLNQYYASRDEVVEMLSALKRGQDMISKKNKITPKPSVILKQIKSNDEASVRSAILRASDNYMKKMREDGSALGDYFESQFQTYAFRMSENNRMLATIQAKKLKEYEKIAGTVAEADSLDGLEFEYWCANLLRKSGFEDVEVTKASGDHGVDVLAVKDDIKYAIQCKCYSSDLDNTPIQEVHAGKTMYGCQIGAVMTNRYFTQGAKELAKNTGTLLWDRAKLIEMIEKSK